MSDDVEDSTSHASLTSMHDDAMPLQLQPLQPQERPSRTPTPTTLQCMLHQPVTSLLIQLSIPALYPFLYTSVHLHHHHHHRLQFEKHPHQHQQQLSRFSTFVHLSIQHNPLIHPLYSAQKWFRHQMQPIISDWCFRPLTQGFAFSLGSYLALFIYKRFVLQLSVAASIPVRPEVDITK